MGKLTFITGGARSGKSSFAEEYIAGSCSTVAYIATARIWDDEMEERVKRHQAQRPNTWQTYEEFLHPSQVISQHGCNFEGFLLDCLTMLTSNIVLSDNSIDWQSADIETLNRLEQGLMEEIDALLKSVQNYGGQLVAVSNEVGLGIVPGDPLSRFFRDCCGRVNQKMAAAAQSVYFVVSGIPMQIKGA